MAALTPTIYDVNRKLEPHYLVTAYSTIPEGSSDKLLVGLTKIKTVVFDGDQDTLVSADEELHAVDLTAHLDAQQIADIFLAIIRANGALTIKSALVEGGTFTPRTVVHFYGNLDSPPS